MIKILLLLLLTPIVSNAECCPRAYPFIPWKHRVCGDGSPVKGRYCGYGKCNIFGCNCDGGCRTPIRMIPFKFGDIIACNMQRLPFLNHVMLAISTTDVIHLDVLPKKSLVIPAQIKLVADTFQNVVTDNGYKYCQIITDTMDKISRIYYNIPAPSDYEIISRVFSSENRTGSYHMFKNNCEHYITQLKYNHSFSLQSLNTIEAISVQIKIGDFPI